ncbi:MAG: S8 family serine peptidase [Proteobacteria bacterium]|nr:S8 family serine peptidase [Pseudomonadota bacterium]
MRARWRRRLSTITLLACLLGPAVVATAASAGAPRLLVIVRLELGAVPESWLVSERQVRAQRRAIAARQLELARELQGHDFRITRVFDSLPYLALDVSYQALAVLAASDRVAEIGGDNPLWPSLATSTVLIEADQVWPTGLDGRGFAVAVLDTGVDADHPHLAGKLVEEACFSALGSCPSGATQQTGPGSAAPCATAGCNHGTHVAGIAVGRSQSLSGVARGADLIALQVFSPFQGEPYCDDDESCPIAFTSDLVKGLEHVYQLRTSHAIAAVNMSLGGGYYSSQSQCDAESPAIKDAIDNLRAAGIATVIASGNDGFLNALSSPGCISSAISVGSTTKSNRVSSFSNSAPFLSLLAPGSSILSSVPGGGFALMSGTSMATPHMAGAWALMKQADPRAGVGTVLERLQATGTPLTDPGNGVTVALPQLAGAAALVPPSKAIEITNLARKKKSKGNRRIPIRWVAVDEIETVSLYYTLDRAETWTLIESGLPAELGEGTWLTPELDEDAPWSKVKAVGYDAEGFRVGGDRNNRWFTLRRWEG